MTQTQARHTTFMMERHFDVPSYKVFAAWADPVLKSQWFRSPLDGAHFSVSLATVEFEADGNGSRRIFTEQDAFLDRIEAPGLWEAGTEMLFDQLVKLLKYWRTKNWSP